MRSIKYGLEDGTLLDPCLWASWWSWLGFDRLCTCVVMLYKYNWITLNWICPCFWILLHVMQIQQIEFAFALFNTLKVINKLYLYLVLLCPVSVGHKQADSYRINKIRKSSVWRKISADQVKYFQPACVQEFLYLCIIHIIWLYNASVPLDVSMSHTHAVYWMENFHPCCPV